MSKVDTVLDRYLAGGVAAKVRLCLLLGLMLLYSTAPAGDGAGGGGRRTASIVRSVAVHVVELTLRSCGTSSASGRRSSRWASCPAGTAATATSSETNATEGGRVQRNRQPRVNRQQVISPRDQVVHVLLQSDVFTPQLMQAGQKGRDVEMLRLLHQELRSLLPLSFQKLLQTLRGVSVGGGRATSRQHRTERGRWRLWGAGIAGSRRLTLPGERRPNHGHGCLHERVRVDVHVQLVGHFQRHGAVRIELIAEHVRRVNHPVLEQFTLLGVGRTDAAAAANAVADL